MRRAVVLAASLILSACADGPPLILVQPYLSAAEVETLLVTGGAASGDVTPFVRPDTLSDDRRWLAMTHAELRPSLAASLFDCALGARLSGARTPALSRIFARLQRDLDAAGRGRRAPSVTAPCTRPNWTPTQGWSGRLPALGVAYAGVMASLAPDRAEALIATGSAIAESAVLCGLSTPEDAASATALAHGTVAAVTRSPAFAEDMAAARAEVAAVRASGLTSPACAAERRALAQ
jgi:acid phosphatase (class A)